MQYIKQAFLFSLVINTLLYSANGRLSDDFYGNTVYEIIETEKTEKKKIKADEKEEDKPKIEIVTKEYLETLNAKEIRELKDELKDIAVIEQTEQSIKNYLVVQKFIDTKSTSFMNQVKIVTKDNQELDIALGMSTSKFARSMEFQKKIEDTKKFYEDNIDKFVLVIFFNMQEDIFNQSIERIMSFIQYDIPIEIRYVDINSEYGKSFAKKRGIIKTPDTWIAFKNNNSFIWERLYTGIPTKEKIYQEIDFVYKNQIEAQLKGGK